jgi:hypothetical protein
MVASYCLQHQRWESKRLHSVMIAQLACNFLEGEQYVALVFETDHHNKFSSQYRWLEASHGSQSHELWSASASFVSTRKPSELIAHESHISRSRYARTRTVNAYVSLANMRRVPSTTTPMRTKSSSTGSTPAEGHWPNILMSTATFSSSLSMAFVRT